MENTIYSNRISKKALNQEKNICLNHIARAVTPFKTGNLRYNGIYSQDTPNGFKIIWNDDFVPYMGYANIFSSKPRFLENGKQIILQYLANNSKGTFVSRKTGAVFNLSEEIEKSRIANDPTKSYNYKAFGQLQETESYKTFYKSNLEEVKENIKQAQENKKSNSNVEYYRGDGINEIYNRNQRRL